MGENKTMTTPTQKHSETLYDLEESRKIIEAIDNETGYYDEIEYEPSITVSGKALWDLRGLAEEALELQQLFDLRWKADMRAIKMWQDAGGDKLTWPDHGKLCVWLLEQLDKARAQPSETPVADLAAKVKDLELEWHHNLDKKPAHEIYNEALQDVMALIGKAGE